jgi:hypothetical protein
VFAAYTLGLVMWGFLLDSCYNDNIVCDILLIFLTCHSSTNSQ